MDAGPCDDKERLYRLALDEAERAIVQQQAALEQLRTRAVALVAVGSGVATFVGVRTDRDLRGLNLLGYGSGVAAYVCSVGLAIWILWPRRNWVFSMDANVIVTSVDAKPDTRGEYSDYVRKMARWTWGHREENQAKLRRLMTLYTWSLGLLGLQVLCWLVAARR